MTLETVEVTALWKPAGAFEPQHFSWKGQKYRVEGVGRHWEDDAGFHVLCMAAGQVYELIFTLNPAVWRMRVPAGPLVA